MRRLAVRSLPWPVIWIGLVSVLVTLGIGVIPPALAQYAQYYELNNAGAGLLLTGFSAGMLLFSVPGGMIADRIGLKSTALAGCVATALGAGVSVLLPNFWLLVFAQAFQGVGSTLYMTAGIAAIMARTSDERIGRTTTTYQGVLVIGMAIAPLVGGWTFALFGLRGPMVACLIGAVIGFVVTAIVVTDTPPSTAPPDANDDPSELPTAARRRHTRELFRERPVILALVMTLMIYIAIGGGRNTLLPLYADAGLAMTPVSIGWLLSVALLGSVIVVPHCGRAIDHGRRRVAVLSTVLFAAAMLLAGLSTVVWVLFIASLVTGMAKGYSAAPPVAIITDVAHRSVYGSAMGLQRAAASLGLVIGPYAAGVLADAVAFRDAFFVFMVLLVITALLLTTMPETMGRRNSRQSPANDDV